MLLSLALQLCSISIYVVDAAQTLGYSCNDFADEVKSKNFEARVHEEGALYPQFQTCTQLSLDR